MRNRLVNFYNIETQTEYRLVTNLPFTGEKLVSNEEVSEIVIMLRHYKSLQ